MISILMPSIIVNGHQRNVNSFTLILFILYVFGSVCCAKWTFELASNPLNPLQPSVLHLISLWLVGCICLLYLEKAFVYHTRKRHLFIVQVADIEHFFPRFTCFLFIFLSRLACKHFTACTTTSQHRPSYSGRTGNVCSLYRLCTFCCSCSMDTPFSLKKSLLLHCPLL